MVTQYANDVLERNRVSPTGTSCDIRAAVMRLVVRCWIDDVPLVDDQVFTEARINDLVDNHLGDLASRTRATYRSRLRAARRAVVKGVEPKNRQIPRETAAIPYTQAQLDELVERAKNFREPWVGRSARVLIAGTAGAGLRFSDYAVVRGIDVRREDGVLLVFVQGDSPREIPVLKEWEDELAEFAGEVGSLNLIRPDLTEPSGHTVSYVVEAINKRRPKGVTELSSLRLRSTWICTHLNSGTPVVELFAAAGIKDGNGVYRYFPFLHRWDVSKTRNIMRNA